MADMMPRRPTGGPSGLGPSGSPGPSPPGPMAQNRSMLNPTDVAAMKQEGGLQAGMSVREFLGRFGVDVDGPVEQLTKLAQKQGQNANVLTKMQNIAGQPGAMGSKMGPPGMGSPAPQGPPSAGGLQGLMREMR